MKNLYYKEHEHLIRRVVELPTYGSATYLYTILGPKEFEYLYRWMPDNTWEEIPLLAKLKSEGYYVEAGINVVLYGVGTKEDPLIINASSNFPEAPLNDKYYARRNGEWEEIVFPDGFPDAPMNGIIYGRQDGEWVEIDTGLEDIIAGENITIDKTNPKKPIINAQSGEEGIAPTGLEALTEGSNRGWRLIGRDPSKYSNLGQDSVDFSVSTIVNGNFGAVGQRSAQFGLNNLTTGKESLTIGNNNKTPYDSSLVVGHHLEGEVTNTNHGSNIFLTDTSWGRNVKTYNNIWASLIGGTSNSIGTSGASIPQAVVYNSIILGDNLIVPGAKESLVVGQALTTGAPRCATVGVANIDLTQKVATGVTGDGEIYGPRFIVGVGNWNSHSNVGTRANGFVVMSDGEVTAPELSIEKINSGPPRTVLTKEYWEQNYIGVKEIIAGDNVEVDNSDPERPIVSALDTAGGGIEEAPSDGKYYARRDEQWQEVETGIEEVVAGQNITVDNTNPKKPVITAANTGGRPYTVYSANITNGITVQSSGQLIVGNEYWITNLTAGDDFSNVGFVGAGAVFVATGSTPNSWSNGTIVIKVTESQPIVHELENTTGATVSWKYAPYQEEVKIGNQAVFSQNLLDKNKTQVFSGHLDSIKLFPSYYYRISSNTIEAEGIHSGASGTNGMTTNIEVKIFP